MFVELTPEQLGEVKANSRSRGLYKAALEKFAESGKAGVQIDTESGDFAGKSVESLYQSFNTHAKKFEGIRVIKNNGNVYLIATEVA